MPIESHLLPSQPAAERKRFVIHRDDHQGIQLEPECPQVERLLQMRVITAADDVQHGYRVDRRYKSLLGLDVDIANAGLAPVVQNMLIQLGFDVDLTPPPVRRLATPLACGNPQVVDLMNRYAHGLVRHSLGSQDLGILCADIAHAFSDARIAFVAVRRNDVMRLHAKLKKHFELVTLAFDRGCQDGGQRLAVTTIEGLAHPDVICDRFDILVFLDACQAIGENGQAAIMGHGRARLFGMIHQDREMPPRIRDLVMAAFGPREVTVPKLGYQNRQIEIAWCKIEGGPELPGHLTEYSLYRRGIVANTVRNRRIARLANAVITNDQHTVKRICPAAANITVRPSSLTAILVDGIEQGLELARLLPKWMLITNKTVNLTGLSTKLRSIHENHCGSVFNSGVIMTAAGMDFMDVSNLDAVIWAGGGIGVPELPRTALMCRATEQRRLVWIDFRDAHHGELRRQSGIRREVYESNQWFPVGVLPDAGRIEQFLAAQPRVKL